MKIAGAIFFVLFGVFMFGLGILALVDVKSAMQLSNSQESIIIALLSWILAAKLTE